MPRAAKDGTVSTKRALALLAIGLAAFGVGGCGETGAAPLTIDASWFASDHWNDGAADVSVFEGRVKRYGAWHAAEVRDFVVREFLDPWDLTKRDAERRGLVPVLKANRLTWFDTGPYEYRLMSSLFFERGTARLVKAVGSSQEACGLTTQRWDRRQGVLAFDSYWEGEGRSTLRAGRTEGSVFQDELPYVAGRLREGARVRVLPSLVANSLRAWKEPPLELVVRRVEGETRLVDEGGATWGTFRYDEAGALGGWTIRDQEEFTRASKEHEYYWVRDGHVCECADGE
jgi:hypothetical protein